MLASKVMNPNENKICPLLYLKLTGIFQHEDRLLLGGGGKQGTGRRSIAYRVCLPKENIGCPRFFLLGGESKQVRVPFSRVINTYRISIYHESSL